MKSFVFHLCFVMLLVFGLGNRAWATSSPVEKTASGIFFEGGNKNAVFEEGLALEPQQVGSPRGHRMALGVRIGPNMYAYVVQNPWTKFDPLGLKTIWHHKYPQKHRDKFENAGINIDASDNGLALDSKEHGKVHKKNGFLPGTGKDQYGDEWDKFFDDLDKHETKNGPLTDSAKKTRIESKLASLEGDKRFSKYLSKGAKLPSGISYGTYSGLSKAEKGQFYKMVWGSNKAGHSVSFLGKAKGALKWTVGTAANVGKKALLPLTVFTVGSTAYAEGHEKAALDFVKSATFYDLTIEPLGNALMDNVKGMQSGQKGIVPGYGDLWKGLHEFDKSFNGRASTESGRQYFERKKLNQ